MIRGREVRSRDQGPTALSLGSARSRCSVEIRSERRAGRGGIGWRMRGQSASPWSWSWVLALARRSSPFRIHPTPNYQGDRRGSVVRFRASNPQPTLINRRQDEQDEQDEHPRTDALRVPMAPGEAPNLEMEQRSGCQVQPGGLAANQHRRTALPLQIHAWQGWPEVRCVSNESRASGPRGLHRTSHMPRRAVQLSRAWAAALLLRVSGAWECAAAPAWVTDAGFGRTIALGCSLPSSRCWDGRMVGPKPGSQRLASRTLLVCTDTLSA